MDYFKIRFINSDSFVSRAIDWVTNSLISHVEIETETGTFIGAHKSGGVRERPADYCTPTWERRYSIPVTKEQLDKAMTFARSKIGTKYDFADIAGLLLHNRSIKSPNKLICSSFVMRTALEGNIRMLNVLPEFAFLITPETLHLSPLLIGHCTYKKTH